MGRRVVDGMLMIFTYSKLGTETTELNLYTLWFRDIIKTEEYEILLHKKNEIENENIFRKEGRKSPTYCITRETMRASDQFLRAVHADDSTTELDIISW